MPGKCGMHIWAIAVILLGLCRAVMAQPAPVAGLTTVWITNPGTTLKAKEFKAVKFGCQASGEVAIACSCAAADKRIIVTGSLVTSKDQCTCYVRNISRKKDSFNLFRQVTCIPNYLSGPLFEDFVDN